MSDKTKGLQDLSDSDLDDVHGGALKPTTKKVPKGAISIMPDNGAGKVLKKKKNVSKIQRTRIKTKTK